MKKFLVFLVLISMITPISIAKDKADDSNYEIEMAEVGEPGTLVIQVWCFNKKPRINDEIVRKYAIMGVLFKDIADNGRMKGRKALVEDGYENHKEYFDDFFEKEKYTKYARIAMNSYVEQNNLIKVGKFYKIGKIVVISYNDLRKQLEMDKIIKGLNYGF